MITSYHKTIRDEKIQILEKPVRGSWICVISPNAVEMTALEQQHNLDPDLLDDGIDLYEAPRLERDGSNIYIYVRYCLPEGEHTSTHPLLLVITQNNIITVSRTNTIPIETLLAHGDIVTTQKVKLILEILEEVNKGYREHLNGVTRHILSTRNKLQKTIVSNEDLLNFINIEEDLNEFLAALQPYGIVLHALLNGKYMKMHEKDEDLVEDLQLSTNELIELTKSRLKTIQNIRDAYSAIATNNLNQIFKRLTSIAIFLTVPTIVGGIFGMNVALPYDHHPYAFWFVLGVMLTVMALFVLYFKRKKWL